MNEVILVYAVALLLGLPLGRYLSGVMSDYVTKPFGYKSSWPEYAI